jgi:hypothetical protein
MILPSSAKIARPWPFALALSLLLHTSLVLPLLFFSSRSSEDAYRGSLLIDTCVAAPATEIHLVICEPRSQVLTSASTGREPEALARVVAAMEKGISGPVIKQAVAEHETAEVQEAPERGQAAGSVQGSRVADPGLGTGTTTFFQIATDAKTIVYVIDRSASMGLNGCLAAAKRELLASLERLPSASRFQIIAYNRSAEPLRINGHSGPVFATPENKRCAALLLDEIGAEGGTEHLQALRRALVLGPDAIFFLTDTADLRANQIQAITSLNRGRSVIHAIELGRASGMRSDAPLYALAKQNQGCYKCAPVGP